MTTGADWMDQARRLVDTFLAGAGSGAESAPAAEGAARHDDAPHDAGHADTCRWCPLCQLAAVVRGERPEVSAALADVLTATAGALRAFAAEGPAEQAAPSPAEDGGVADPGAVVQQIDIA